MKTTSTSIIICLLTLSLFIAPQPAFACSPIFQTPQEMFASSDAVFIGKISSVVSVSATSTVVNFTANAQVQKSWKGNVSGTVKIISKAFATCPSGFTKSDEGKTRLFYAVKTSNTNEYNIGMIHMKDILYAEKDIAFLDSTISTPTPSTPTTPASKPSNNNQPFIFTRNLKMGLSGPDVIKMQDLLEQKKFLIMPRGVNKGYFGSLTRDALIKYQKSQNITPAVGFFGKITQSSLTR